MRKTLVAVGLAGMSLLAVPGTAAAASADVPGVWTCAEAKENTELKGAVTATDCRGPEGHFVGARILTNDKDWHCLSGYGGKSGDSVVVGGLGCKRA
ncbi:hypothetical protein ACFQVC_07355 [Streptomyces monticola]|uniref:Secreted protein n=1 Tax=Streptomyces monticola TaxID=2666263 RepID=A0ABW2JDC4_9ACTN